VSGYGAEPPESADTGGSLGPHLQRSRRASARGETAKPGVLCPGFGYKILIWNSCDFFRRHRDRPIFLQRGQKLQHRSSHPDPDQWGGIYARNPASAVRAGFLLTLLLLPLIKNSAPARIVNVSSAGQQPIDFGDVMLTRGYSGTRAYCQSKLAQIMFTIDLGARINRPRSCYQRRGCVNDPPRHGYHRNRDGILKLLGSALDALPAILHRFRGEMRRDRG
jgi:hypothetical protein